MEDIKKRFDLTVKTISKLRIISDKAKDEELKKLYGLYKQAIIGDCNIDEPSKILNYKDNVKWNSWNSNKGMKKSDAMSKYSDHAMTLINKYS